MWMREIAGFDLYHLIAGFCVFSVLGWLVESIYMSFCNRKITNRGFMTSPFCPIYGFGAVLGYLILHPLEKNVVVLYLVGALIATIFEYLVGRLMIRLFGELWWDYNDKPFNYKGIVCLESTIAWGFYALGVVHFVHAGINWLIDMVSIQTGIRLIVATLALVAVDYAFQLIKVLNIDVHEKKQYISDKCHRWLERIMPGR